MIVILFKGKSFLEFFVFYQKPFLMVSHLPGPSKTCALLFLQDLVHPFRPPLLLRLILVRRQQPHIVCVVRIGAILPSFVNYSLLVIILDNSGHLSPKTTSRSRRLGPKSSYLESTQPTEWTDRWPVHRLLHKAR